MKNKSDLPQSKLQQNPNSDQIGKLNSLIKDIKFAMMTTHNEKGQIHSRPMVTRQIDSEGNLWFITDAHSHKISELKKNHQVNLIFCSTDNHRFISITGDATILKDRQKAEEIWNPFYRAWFPKGLEDPNLVLLQVKVKQAEYWNSVSNTVVQLLGYAKAVLTGTRHAGEGTEHDVLDCA